MARIGISLGPFWISGSTRSGRKSSRPKSTGSPRRRAVPAAEARRRQDPRAAERRPGWHRQLDSWRYWDGCAWEPLRSLPLDIPAGWYGEYTRLQWWYDGVSWTEYALPKDVRRDLPPDPDTAQVEPIGYYPDGDLLRFRNEQGWTDLIKADPWAD